MSTSHLSPAATEHAPPPESPLQQLPTTRRAILNLLKRQGPLDAAAVAHALSLTPSAVRLQLTRLEEDGLLAHRDEVAHGPRRGRPRHVYELTSAAEALYPKRYGDLTTELLGYLGGPGGSQVDELFEQRRQRRVADALPRTADRPFDEQVAALTKILDDDGYLADAERLDDGSWRITEHNCAILTVAHGFSQACTSELAFIRDALPGATVRRVAHLMDGAHVCAYVVSPPPS
ncbi:MAG TPA: winged helix-turn-helix transcriptional regulator [Acidimicrobiales bacterium]|nr:winged helix-turn-helix transcriptional regulator [Acidimicrobiales bacterium]